MEEIQSIQEKNILTTKPTSIGGFGGILIFLLGMLISVSGNAASPGHGAQIIVGMFFIASGLGLFWDYAFTELTITNKRICYKRGMIFKDTKEILLKKIESVQVNTGVFGFFFGYGDVIIKGTGGTEIKLKDFSSPKKIRTSILEGSENE